MAFSHGEFRQGTARRRQLSAQHRRWNPRRNFRFRRGTAALAEPKDDRSANEIARDNSLPRGSLLLRFSSCISLARERASPPHRLAVYAPLSSVLRALFLRSPPSPPSSFGSRDAPGSDTSLLSSIDRAAHDECVVRSERVAFYRKLERRFVQFRLDTFLHSWFKLRDRFLQCAIIAVSSLDRRVEQVFDFYNFCFVSFFHRECGTPYLQLRCNLNTVLTLLSILNLT